LIGVVIGITANIISIILKRRAKKVELGLKELTPKQILKKKRNELYANYISQIKNQKAYQKELLSNFKKEQLTKIANAHKDLLLSDDSKKSD
jgi:hypothetical protein